MGDIDIFKFAANKTLPEALYQQLLPHLDSLLNTYETGSAAKEGDLYELACENNARYQEIQGEFEDATAANWQAFARERWPDIDKTYDLEAMHKQRNLPPSNIAPWARPQPTKCPQPPWKKS